MFDKNKKVVEKKMDSMGRYYEDIEGAIEKNSMIVSAHKEAVKKLMNNEPNIRFILLRFQLETAYNNTYAGMFPAPMYSSIPGVMQIDSFEDFIYAVNRSDKHKVVPYHTKDVNLDTKYYETYVTTTFYLVDDFPKMDKILGYFQLLSKLEQTQRALPG